MYFSSFPTANFNGTELLDITRRFDLGRIADTTPLTYMNYTIQDGETPEDIAFYYYDDPSYAWLVLLSNNILDPYTHWPKPQRQFDEYIKSEYATQSGTTGQAVIEWTKNENISQNIMHYQNIYFNNVQINRSSWNNLTSTGIGVNSASNQLASVYDNFAGDTDVIRMALKEAYYPVRIYDYELELNDSRKEIQLVNKSLLPQIKEQIETILNDK